MLEFAHCSNIVVILKKAKKSTIDIWKRKKNLGKDSCDKVCSWNFVNTDFTKKIKQNFFANI